MSALDLSIIIVSHSTPQLVARALTSLMVETRQSSYEVIVAEIDPSEEPANPLGNHPVAPLLLKLPADTSSAKAINQAARVARGKYILLLHADALVIDRAIDRLVKFAAAHPEARIWGGRTLYQNRRLDPKSCYRHMTVWSLFCRACGLAAIFKGSELFNAEAYGGWLRNTVRNVDIVADAFFLIERDLWNGLKGFDTAFETSGQEVDLCLRARAFTARPMFTPDSTILHSGKPDDLQVAGFTAAMIAARMALVQRHWSRTAAPAGRFLLNAWPLTRAIATTVAARLKPTGRARHTAAHWQAVWKRRNEWAVSAGPEHPAAATAISAAAQTWVET